MNWLMIYLFLFLVSLVIFYILWLNEYRSGKTKLKYIALAGILIFGVLAAGMME